MGRLPAGYEEHHNEDMSYFVRSGEHEAAREMGLTDLFNIEDMLAAGAPGGRGRTFVVPRPQDGPGEELVLKQVLHGGLTGKLNRGRFWGPGRLFRELRVTVAARDRGVPVPEIAFGAWTRARFPRLFLATVRVPASRSLDDAARAEPPGRGRRLYLEAAGTAVAEMHLAGLVHGDLNLRNVMVSEVEWPPEGFVIDLDRARLVDALRERHRAADLARLLRSVEKNPRASRRITLLERARFLRAYCGGLTPGYARLKVRIAARRRWFFLHRLAWRLRWR